MRKRTATLLVLLVAACGSLPYQSGLETAGYRTLWVENRTLNALSLYIGPGLRKIGWVQPGRGSCIRLRVHTAGSVRLLADPVGGEPAIVSPDFDPNGYPGWQWIVGPIDALKLEPMRPPCGERRA